MAHPTRLSFLFPAGALVAALALAGCGGGGAAAASGPLQPPATAPTGLTLVPGVRHIDVRWDALPGASGYALYLGRPDAESPSWTIVTGILGTEYALTDLLDGRRYSCRVAARNDFGEGPLCAEVGATVAPGAPPAPSARAGNALAHVSWGSAGGATSYDLYVSDDPALSSANWASLPGAQRFLNAYPPVQVPSLTNGTTTYLCVVAHNLAGRSPDSPLGQVVPDARGSFEPGSVVAAAAAPQRTLTVYLNGDLDPDLLMPDPVAGDVLVLLGRGDGTFAPAVRYPAGATPVALACDDLDGDGDLDVVSANQGDVSVAVLLGDGTGALAAPTNYTVGAAPSAVVAVELSAGSGVLDLVVANRDDGTLSVLAGLGDGTFVPVQTLLTGILPVPDPDLPSVNPAGGRPVQLVAGDFDRDGFMDVVTADELAVAVCWHAGDGAGGLLAPVLSTTLPNPSALDAQDFDLDGDLELLVTSSTAPAALTMGNLGDGRFGALYTHVGVGAPAGVGIGDFDGDGVLDMALANRDESSISILLGNGAGVFELRETMAVAGRPMTIAVADVNRDGIQDLVALDPTTGEVRIFLGLSS